MADRLVQPVRVARGEAEVVVRGNELRIDPEGPVVVHCPPGHRTTEGLVVGLGIRGVDPQGPLIAVVGLVHPAPARQGDAEHVLGPGELGVDPQRLPVVGDRLVQPALIGPDLGEVVVSRGQLGVEPDGLPEVVNRFRPLALAFQGQAEVVVGRGKVGVDLEGLLVVIVGLVPIAPGERDEAEVVVDGGRVPPEFQRPPVGGDRGLGVRALLQRPGQGQGGPEVVRMRLLHSRQEGDPVAAEVLQPLPQRDQDGRGLPCHRRGPGQCGQGGAVVPRRGIADAVAPGVRVGLPRHAQDPRPAALVGGADRPVVQRGHQRLARGRGRDPRRHSLPGRRRSPRTPHRGTPPRSPGPPVRC